MEPSRCWWKSAANHSLGGLLPLKCFFDAHSDHQQPRAPVRTAHMYPPPAPQQDRGIRGLLACKQQPRPPTAHTHLADECGWGARGCRGWGGSLASPLTSCLWTGRLRPHQTRGICRGHVRPDPPAVLLRRSPTRPLAEDQPKQTTRSWKLSPACDTDLTR